MLPKNVLYYGRSEPLPRQQELRAGPLSLLYEEGDLRYIRLDDREVLRRVYVAVRDRNWGTIVPRLSNLQMEIGSDCFHIEYDANNKQGDIDFFWKGTITGNSQGTITFTMDGQVRSTFLHNRIGFCVLHPIRECAGTRCLVEQMDHVVVQGTFPRYISPQQPFMNMKAISHEIIPGTWAEVRFTGDIFEMEDQRNWTDASYKTYCTPLSLPYPVEVKQGTTISQSITLTLKGNVPELRMASPGEGVLFQVAHAPTFPLPHIGLAVASHGQPLSQREIARLKALSLSHLRVDLQLFQPDYAATLQRGSAEARALGVPLEIALFLSDNAYDELQQFIAALGQIKPTVCTWLIFHKQEKSTTEHWIKLARTYLIDYDPIAKIGGGTNAYFAELNRNRPPLQDLNLVSYSITPQVHAFDNASLVETLEAQASTVESAHEWSTERLLAITPITLKQRFNPNATGLQTGQVPNALPAQVDVRQMSLFGGGWTIGSLKYLAESSVYSLTYYETSGWRGVMETEIGSLQPEQFRSLPGSVFPLYHVLADAGEFAGGHIIPTTSSSPLHMDGLAMYKNGRTRVLLANLSAAPQPVMVQHVSEFIQIRHLNETNAEEAMRSPEEFRTREGELMQTSEGSLDLTLLPYAIARIDMVKES